MLTQRLRAGLTYVAAVAARIVPHVASGFVEHWIAPCAEVYCSAKDVVTIWVSSSNDCWATLLGAHFPWAHGTHDVCSFDSKSGGGPFAGLWLGSGSVAEQKQEQGKNDFRILRGFRRRHQPQVAAEFSSPGCAGVHQNRQGGLESDKQFQTSGRASDEAWSSTITSKSSDEARHTASLAPRAVHTSNPAFCSVIGEIVQAPGRTVDAQNAVCRVGHGDTLLPVEGPPGMHSLEQLTRFFVKTL